MKTKTGRSPPRPKLLVHEDVPVGEPDVDYSDIVTDLEEMRVPQNDVARDILAAAKKISGSAKTLAQGRTDVFKVNPFDLHIMPGWNVREMESRGVLAHIKYLAHDIARRGVLEPYSVYSEDGRLYISNGNLRQHAVFYAINVLGADIRLVPVKLGPPGENEQDRVLRQVHSNSGLRLAPWEQGTLFKKFLGWGWDNEKIATETGYTVAHVGQMLHLQEMPEPLAVYVRKEIVSASYAQRAYKEAGESVPKALSEIESAIRYADHTGADKVMPKHGRKARASGGGASKKREATGNGGSAHKRRLDSVVEILRNVTVTADGEGRWTVTMTIEEGERLSKLTGMEVPRADDDTSESMSASMH